MYLFLIKKPALESGKYILHLIKPDGPNGIRAINALQKVVELSKGFTKIRNVTFVITVISHQSLHQRGL